MTDLNDVAIFVQVARSRSFTGAARVLRRPKTSVGRAVARLEATLGVRLLHRTTRRLELTSAGQVYFDRVATALDAVHAASAASAQPRPSGLLRILAPTSLGEHFLAARCFDFLRAHPGVSIELLLSDAELDMIEQRIDLAFRIEPQLTSSSFIARKLLATRKVLVVEKQFAEAKGMPLSLSSLSNFDCVILGRTVQTIWTLKSAAGIEDVPVTGRFAATTTDAALAAVKAGLGIGLLPDNLVRDDIERGTLVAVLPDYVTEDAGLYAIYPSRKQALASIQALLSALTTWIKEMEAVERTTAASA
jgi:DNA-binding transcriptional LysR family regulator